MRLWIYTCLLMSASMGMAQEPVIQEHLDMAGPFETPQAVTRACIECHEDQAEDLSHSRHWNWLGEEFEKDGEIVRLGKQNMLNNYCINISSNQPRCTSCHVGYGWKDDSFDFTAKENMDCLVCHEQTGTYKKFPTDAGYPVYDQEEKLFKTKNKIFKKVDLAAVAQSVAMPTNRNCGTCHFYGGGGHNVKHGDLTNALVNATFETDVHMGNPDPEKRLSCVDCHAAGDNKHDIRGSAHASSAAGQNKFSCIDCHEETGIHTKKMGNMLNMHAESIDCVTCHIPSVANKYPTKTWWDWETAGDKKREVKKDANGMPDYNWKKGDFGWEANLEPELFWSTGITGMYLLGEEIETDEDGLFTFNPLIGGYDDPDARISAFKVMRGRQFYDTQTKMMLVPHLFGPGGYWKTADWGKAFTNGMAAVDLPFSGEYAAVDTEMYWPVYHMVAPAERAPKCVDCHTKNGESGFLDWERFGYPGDPVKTGRSRLSDGILDK